MERTNARFQVLYDRAGIKPRMNVEQVHVGPKMTIEYKDLYLKKPADDLP